MVSLRNSLRSRRYHDTEGNQWFSLRNLLSFVRAEASPTRCYSIPAATKSFFPAGVPRCFTSSFASAAFAPPVIGEAMYDV